MYRVTLPTNYAEDYLIKLGLEPKKKQSEERIINETCIFGYRWCFK